MLTPIDTDLGERSVRSVLYAQKKPRSFQISLAVLAASFVLALCCASCGAVGSASPPSPAVTITVTPASARPYQGETWQFRAAVQNAANPAIEWQVNGINGGNSQYGTIDLNGLYTAPSAVPSPPTVTVSAALQSNTTKIGSASVTVLDLSSITGTLILSPEFSGATTTQTVQFNVLTPGVTDAEVKWSATGGTITSDGKYSSPGVPGPYTVIATLLANSNTAGSAIVEVTDFAGTLTWRNDNARSGINNRELALAPGNVNSPKFGKIFSCPIDGYAYAQPLYVPNLPIPGSGAHNVIFVATDKNSVFAFDADDKSCNQLWPGGPTTLGLSTVPNTNTNNFPVGIIGTPVISQGTDALYVVAATETFVTGSPVYSHRLYALDLATGHLVIQPAGVSIATPDSVFHSSVEKQRAALLTSNGTVYVAFGSTENPGDYHGWLLVYDAATLQPTGAFNSTQPPAVQGGIWQSGGGPSADSNGNVFVVTGDGPFNADRMPNSFSYGDSFLRLGAGASGALSVLDYFTPCDQQTLETKGLDVGASAPVLLPDSAGSRSEPHLLLGGSKGGSLYVVNRDSMGKFTPGLPSPPAPQCSDSPAGVQTVTVPVVNGTILSTPLFWNNSVYVAPGNGHLMSFPMIAGILSLTPSATQSPETLGPQGATPVISSNGTNSAILWLIDTSGASTNAPAILRAYDANNLSNEIYSSPADAASPNAAGPAVKFTVPTVANGKVYVGTQTELDVYGFLP